MDSAYRRDCRLSLKITCTVPLTLMLRNPEEEDEDPIPIYFELNHCNYNCTNSKYDIEKTLEEYKFLGLSMTIEVII